MSNDILAAGEMLSWYRIVGVLGRGGFGVTYEALDTNLNMTVAIKEYLPANVMTRNTDNSVRPVNYNDEQVFAWGLKGFIGEARTLAKFQHPNIIRVLSVFEQNGTAYMIMEYERGDDLKIKLANCPEVREESSLRNIIKPVLSGLSEVHLHGFIHRDIKPSNLYIRNNGTPVLLDFGSARRATDQSMQTLTSLVSTGFAPLEQYSDSESGQQGPWTDIYALGAVLHFAITEQAPVDSLVRAAAVVNGKSDPYTPLRNFAQLQEPRRYNEHFLDAIDWALSFKIGDRPQSLTKWKQRLLDDDSTLVHSGKLLGVPPDSVPAESSGPVVRASKETSVDTAFGSKKWLTRWLLFSTVTLLMLVLYLLQRNPEPSATTSLASTNSIIRHEAVIIDPASAIVEVPRIAASHSPAIDGMYDAIWNTATYNDTTPNLLAINKLIVGSDPTRSDRQTEYKWGALHDGSYLYIMVFGENVADSGLFADSEVPWDDDNLNLFLDTDNSKSRFYDGVNDYDINIPLLRNDADPQGNTNLKPGYRMVLGEYSAPIDDAITFANCRCDAGQHTWELRIDLDAVGLAVGRLFGIELQIDNDIDGGSRDVRWGWWHSMVRPQDSESAATSTRLFGSAVLQ